MLAVAVLALSVGTASGQDNYTGRDIIRDYSSSYDWPRPVPWDWFDKNTDPMKKQIADEKRSLLQPVMYRIAAPITAIEYDYINNALEVNIHAARYYDNTGAYIAAIRDVIGHDADLVISPGWYPMYSFLPWVKPVVDLWDQKSAEFQETYPIATVDGMNDLLRWAGRPDVQAKEKNAALTESGYGYVYTAMNRWEQRPDLREAFPEASEAYMTMRLLTWAGNPVVLDKAANSNLLVHEPTYTLLHIFFMERDDLRAHIYFYRALDGSDLTSLYCWADYVLNGDGDASNDDARLVPHKDFYKKECTAPWY